MPTAPAPADHDRRRQLTLFVAEPEQARWNALRAILDPVQAALIAAHVTLCREDEIGQLDPSAIFRRVRSWPHGPITLQFDRPTRFGGHGVLLPCRHGAAQFQRLRQWLLQDQSAREHGAHLTLAHPRNPKSANNTDAALASCPENLELQFASVALIEQLHQQPWRVLEEAVLGADTNGSA